MAQIINKTVIYARIILPFVVLAASLAPVRAQSVPQPDRERLLNGLTILYSNRPGDPKVLLKLRIQSGAAFDLAGKAGTMALLADAMFPESTTGEYVTEQLGGQLKVATTYDAIDVTIDGKAAELERMIDLLRNALMNLNLSPESVATLREAKIKQLSGKQSSISDAANRAIARRLFGTYPYGQPPEGTVETVAKIERGDLMLARDRFLNADDATLVVIGGAEKARLMRAARQILGPWQKSDRIVPATFRQPGPVNSHVLLIDQSGADNAEVRLAVRGLARSDPDAPAAFVLAAIARKRWQALMPGLSAVSVEHEAHALQGMFVLGARVPAGSAAKAIATAKEVMKTIAQSGATQEEVSEAITTFPWVSHRLSPDESLADKWLDAETYKIPLSTSPADVNRISPADIKRVAARLFGEPANQAIVVLGNASELKSQFGDQAELPVNLTRPSSNSSLPNKKP
jgi:predicted Zn-dependent peptidase